MRNKKIILYLLFALMFLQTAFPADLYAAEPLETESYDEESYDTDSFDELYYSGYFDSVDQDNSFSGTLSPEGGGKYQVSLSDTVSGNFYTVIVLAGTYDAFPENSIEELTGQILYIDMKAASGETLTFKIKPKKPAMSTVFVANGDGIPVVVGKIDGEPYTADEQKKCTISFNSGGGTGSMSSVIVNQGELFTLPKCGFIPAALDKVFDRWDGGAAGDVIMVFDDMTFTALWKVPESNTQEDPTEEEIETGDGSGLKVELVDQKATYVYTGAPVKPRIKAFYDGKELVPDDDYSVSYENNINASAKSKALVTVNGKGGFSGKASVEFVIKPKSVKKGDTEGGTVPVDIPETIYVLKGTKKTQVNVIYGNYTLKPGNVDYSLTAPYGGFNYDTEIAVNSNGKSGNFVGSRSIKVKVVDSSELKSHAISVSVGRENYTYDGLPKSPSDLKVYAPDGTDITDQKDTAYKILYLSDNTDSGSVKYTIVGLYPYSGEHKDSFKINPVSVTPAVEISESADYKNTGAVPEKVRITSGGKELVSGKDYKISFSSNKKVGKGKYNISFIGNYSKTKKIAGTFDINPASINDARIVIPDMIYAKKAGIYSSAPLVEVNGLILKKNDMMVDYLDSEGRVISKNNPVDLSGKDFAKVSVSITGKGNYSGKITGDYTVWKDEGNLVNLNKSRIVTDELKAIGKQNYTGFEIRPSFICQVKDGKNWTTVSSSKYRTYYIGNIKKGTAYIVIKPVDNSGLVGSKSAKFSIAIKKW